MVARCWPVLLLLIGTATAGGAEELGRIVARIDGRPVLAADQAAEINAERTRRRQLAAERERLTASGAFATGELPAYLRSLPDPLDDAGIAAVAFGRLKRRAAVPALAARLGVTVTDDEVAAEMYRRRLLGGAAAGAAPTPRERRAVYDELLLASVARVAVPSPSAAAVSAWIATHGSALRLPGDARIAHIFVRRSEDQVRDRERLEGLSKQAAAITAWPDFARIAAARNDDPRAAADGTIGWLEGRFGAPFTAEVLAAPVVPGLLPRILTSPRGWHLVWVLALRPEGGYTPADLRRGAMEALFRESLEQLLDRTAAELTVERYPAE